MSDLIHKEDVIKIIDEEIKAKSDYLQHNAQIDIMYKVQELPPVEARPVVHCRDCCFLEVCKTSQWLGLDGYCSRGEKHD